MMVVVTYYNLIFFPLNTMYNLVQHRCFYSILFDLFLPPFSILIFMHKPNIFNNCMFCGLFSLSKLIALYAVYFVKWELVLFEWHLIAFPPLVVVVSIFYILSISILQFPCVACGEAPYIYNFCNLLLPFPHRGTSKMLYIFVFVHNQLMF